MPDTKQYLTRNGTFQTLDQIVSAAKSDGVAIFADDEWVIRVNAKRRSKTAARTTISTLADEELDAVFRPNDRHEKR